MSELDRDTIYKILQLRKDGKGYREIGRELNIDAKQARKYCVLYGLDGVQTLLERNREEDRKLIAKCYTEEGMTPNEISRKLHKSPDAIRKSLYKLGLWEKREYHREQNGEFKDIPMPPLRADNEPVYYPEREIEKKTVIINGKRYIDVSEVYGI